jgi:hypothetical protein
MRAVRDRRQWLELEVWSLVVASSMREKVFGCLAALGSLVPGAWCFSEV